MGRILEIEYCAIGNSVQCPHFAFYPEHPPAEMRKCGQTGYYLYSEGYCVPIPFHCPLPKTKEVKNND